jgi:hypothetical protein
MSKLPEDRFKLATYGHNEWSVDLPADTAYEDVFKPEFWAHNAKKVRPQDKIVVRREDGTLYAELFVRACGPLFVKADEIIKVEFGKQAATDSDKLKVKWIGRNSYTVVRKTDNQVLRDGFQTPEDAAAWMHNHNQQMAA